ncbi:redox-sensing transcriptional regulator Rex [Gordonia effusa NBRC 100432]|uniref:Redox-sensing transcriptional repressor Rex n=1 Tax=Gordonia effusa NBRC 100432 TaxID=1077974 RepID=H0QYH1_9ACTN|nr:redox-sensing transcriptional repressor Rex [Gordonia effusa]GAB17872.1 redox-sensing transcriptional regulator Rex [Gordonia effusa NBRC 100432]
MTALSDDTVPTRIPGPAVARLALYLHVLRTYNQRGVAVTSSQQLSTAAGVNPAILRKDLSYVGANGVRGVGYDVSKLIARVAMALHTDDTHNVALAGASRLGHALLAHTGIGRGFTVTALFDDDPELIGRTLADDGPIIEPLHAIPTSGGWDIGVIATSDDRAQEACDAFIAAGVRQILNVTATTLVIQHDTPGVAVRQVDLALELQVLSFQAKHAAGAAGHTTAPTPAEYRETMTS